MGCVVFVNNEREGHGSFSGYQKSTNIVYIGTESMEDWRTKC